MSGLFRWSMRHGAKIVFAVAVLQLAGALLVPLAALTAETSRMAADHGYSAQGDVSTLIQVGNVILSLTGFAFLLVGALIIDRADRWLALRGAGEARND